jgi:membrane protein required for colicin V production
LDGITILDIIIGAIFMYFIMSGYYKGFIKQTSTILGLLVALVIAIKQYQNFQVYLEPYLDVSLPMQQFISFAAIFIIFNLVIHILGLILKNVINLMFLDPVDHIAGAVLGLLKGGILVYFFVLILVEIPLQGLEEMIDKSFLATNILGITPYIHQNIKVIFGHK